jgi:hypothetical protein
MATASAAAGMLAVQLYEKGYQKVSTGKNLPQQGLLLLQVQSTCNCQEVVAFIRWIPLAAAAITRWG